MHSVFFQREHLLRRTQCVTNMVFGLLTRLLLLTCLVAVLLVSCDGSSYRDISKIPVHIKVVNKYLKDLENNQSEIYKKTTSLLEDIVQPVPGFPPCFITNVTYHDCYGQTIATIHVCRDQEVKISEELDAVRREFENRGLPLVLPMDAPLDCKAVQQPSIALGAVVPVSPTIQMNLDSYKIVTCEASGVTSQDQVDFHWYLGSDIIPEKEIRSTVISSGTGIYISREPTRLLLHFKKVQMEDAGYYTCKLTISGRNFNKSFDLEINGKSNGSSPDNTTVVSIVKTVMSNNSSPDNITIPATVKTDSPLLPIVVSVVGVLVTGCLVGLVVFLRKKRGSSKVDEDPEELDSLQQVQHSAGLQQGDSTLDEEEITEATPGRRLSETEV